MKNQKEKSTVSWLEEFAGGKKQLYLASVLFAVLGVVCGIIPYVLIAHMVTGLVAGNRDWMFYLRDGLIMAAFWIGRVTFHGLSTSCSHKATFHVLAVIRKRLCDKLSRVPLGRVKDTPSGTLKNIMVERVDSIETTLAHVLPEFTANLLAPVMIFVYLLIIDWRMALSSLITLVIGMFAYISHSFRRSSFPHRARWRWAPAGAPKNVADCISFAAAPSFPTYPPKL